jgi:hypothetical protein
MSTSGWDGVTSTDIAKLTRKSPIRARRPLAGAQTAPGEAIGVRLGGSRQNKYHNQKTPIDGIVFDSMKEAGRYLYLRNLRDAGLVTELRLQHRWEIFVDTPTGRRHIAWWLSDFDYWLEGAHLVEDVKSTPTRNNPVYRLKRKLIEALYGFEIHEV